jgi:hypothetical protein
MAIVNDSIDKMRDIIAAEAEKLETGAESDVEGDVETPEPTDVEAEAEVEPVEDVAPVVEPGVAAEADPAVDPPVVDKAVVDGAADKTAAAAKKEDPFAKEHGLKATDKLGRVNRIPYPVVKDRIVPNAIKKAEAAWTKDKLEPVQRTVKDYETRLNAIAETERIQFEEPRRFLTMLAHIPGYTQLFDELSQGKFSANAAAAEKGPRASVPADDQMPTADAKDKDGNIIGWTHEGMEKRFAWERRQAARDAKTEAMKELQPMRDRFEADQAAQAVTESIDGIIGLAADWPGFKDNYVPILEALGKGTEKLDTPQKMYRAVQMAYNEVMFGVVGKAKETEEERRARYFKDFTEQQRRAPRSTAARSTVRREEPVVEQEHASPDDRMRNIITESARKAGLL